MEKLTYPNKPIYSIKSLALLLNIAEKDLQKITQNSDKYFVLNEQRKKDGSIRKCYNLKHPLKNIHKRIKQKITSQVIYPYYIQGSIKGRSNLTNAQLHEKSKTIVQLDIKDFYPSITDKQIYNLWRYFFNFSKKVSSLLTRLITLNGEFIQGSPISSDIANLIFWDKEQYLVRNLENDNLTYSRYVDDVNISSKSKIPNKLKTDIINKINAMLKAKNLKLKNKKTKILNQNDQLLITGLVVNHKAKVNKQYIDDVFQEIKNENFNENSVRGKVNYIHQTNPKQANAILRIANL
jgi:hypothetical protein